MARVFQLTEKRSLLKWLYHLTFQCWWFQWLLDGVLQCHQTLTCTTIYLPRIVLLTVTTPPQHSAVVRTTSRSSAADRPRGKRRAHPLSIFQIGYFTKIFSPKIRNSSFEFQKILELFCLFSHFAHFLGEQGKKCMNRFHVDSRSKMKASENHFCL